MIKFVSWLTFCIFCKVKANKKHFWNFRYKKIHKIDLLHFDGNSDGEYNVSIITRNLIQNKIFGLCDKECRYSFGDKVNSRLNKNGIKLKYFVTFEDDHVVITVFAHKSKISKLKLMGIFNEHEI